VSLTQQELGYQPMSMRDGLGLLIPWLRELGRLDPA
jgi:dihydroflavonol-4-reductase